MSTTTVIQVDDVRKRYQLGATDHRQLKQVVASLFGSSGTSSGPIPAQREGDRFWALRGLSFQVDQGEVVGLIGRNGAGKSTLLKLLSRITRPTSGTLRMRGHASSLLEVGTGFHPELTGRENIFLNGAIMGMRRAEISAKLDEILAFSGIEHHIDTPIKRYSSGMKVRLGFAVAAHLDPDILIVDEVLAVGDAEFQKRCLGRMRSVADSGRTVIFVSHNMFSVQSLCTRAIWLDEGLVRADGAVEEVVGGYIGAVSDVTHDRTWPLAEAPGTDELRLVGIRATAENGLFRTTAPVTVELDLHNSSIHDTDLNIQLIVRTEDDAIAFVTDMTEVIGTGLWPLGASKVRCIIPADLLNDGPYRFSVLFQRKANRLFLEEDILRIAVQEGPRQGAWFQKWRGAVRPKLQWER